MFYKPKSRFSILLWICWMTNMYHHLQSYKTESLFFWTRIEIWYFTTSTEKKLLHNVRSIMYMLTRSPVMTWLLEFEIQQKVLWNFIDLLCLSHRKQNMEIFYSIQHLIVYFQAHSNQLMTWYLQIDWYLSLSLQSIQAAGQICIMPQPFWKKG